MPVGQAGKPRPSSDFRIVKERVARPTRRNHAPQISKGYPLMVRISPVPGRGTMNRSLLGGSSIRVDPCSSVANSVFLDRLDSYGCNADRIPGRVLGAVLRDRRAPGRGGGRTGFALANGFVATPW